jgi:hypothetical protein
VRGRCGGEIRATKVEGLSIPTDTLEALAGDMSGAEDLAGEEPDVVARADGSLLID